jgi:adenylate cyclase
VAVFGGELAYRDHRGLGPGRHSGVIHIYNVVFELKEWRIILHVEVHVGIEIERKFLLKNDDWRALVSHSTEIRQGYLAPPTKASVRIRLDGEQANINIKSATLGMHRLEYEYPIPRDEAIEMLDQLCEQPQIAKQRHRVKWGEHIWEIDEFFGDNSGLVVAEIELATEDEAFDMPQWIGAEVTDDKRYYNVSLAKHPYRDWKDG